MLRGRGEPALQGTKLARRDIQMPAQNKELVERLFASCVLVTHGSERVVERRINPSEPRRYRLLLVFDVQRQRDLEVTSDLLCRVSDLIWRRGDRVGQRNPERRKVSNTGVAFEQQVDDVT